MTARFATTGPAAEIREALATATEGCTFAQLRETIPSAPSLSDAQLRNVVHGMVRKGLLINHGCQRTSRYALTAAGRKALADQMGQRAARSPEPTPRQAPSAPRATHAVSEPWDNPRPGSDGGPHVGMSTLTALKAKDAERAELARLLSEFQARGGRVTQLGNTPVRKTHEYGRMKELH